ncbi:MAG TPA: tetratricopeptide repeat protein [Longimicrobiaceae bacterium]|jgi:tetratricopeptide (TPR) repeat protein
MPNRSRLRPSHSRPRPSRARAAAFAPEHAAQPAADAAIRHHRRAAEPKQDSAAAHVGPQAGGLVPALRLFPAGPATDAARACLAAGVHFQAMGETGLAEAAYRESLALDGGIAETHNNLGVLLRARGDRDGGLAAFRRAAELRPDYPEALGNLGLALGERGDLAGARECFRAAVAAGPERAAAHGGPGAAHAPAPAGRTAPLPSVERLPNGAARFTLHVPLAALAADGFETYSLELAGGGVDRDLRHFLERELRDGDAFLDVGAGWGFAALAAATVPGRAVRVLALVGAAAEQAVLRSGLAGAAITGSLEALATDAPGRTPPDLLLADPAPRRGNVFLRVSDAGALPDVLAGSAGLVASGRLACLAWRCRPGPDGAPAQADRAVLASLSALGFRHFRVREDDAGCQLAPLASPPHGEHVFSLSAAYLAARPGGA